MVGFLKAITSWLNWLLKAITPPRYFSWQTAILLSVFSWLMSLLSQAFWLANILINMAWLFLIIGVYWGLVEHPIKVGKISLGPWITGALVCIFLFSQESEVYFRWAVVSWPLVSAIIAALPQLLSWNLRIRPSSPQERQDLVLLLLINLLLSCWLLFSFRVQDWLEGYPSLLADDFDQSAFIFTWEEPQTEISRSRAFLEQVESRIQSEIGDRPWPYVERWLINLDEQLPDLQQTALDTMSQLPENRLWQLIAKPETAASGYNLRLYAVWAGPTSYPEGYYFEKVCQIMPRQPNPQSNADQPISRRAPATPPPELTAARTPPPTPIAQIECNSPSPLQAGRPQSNEEG